MDNSVRILLLEDNPDDGELLQATLETAGLSSEIVRVETESQFSSALGDHFDLIVSNYSLPSFGGKKALALARERRPDIPFVFVSGTIGEEFAIESLLSGASDYVLKHQFGRLVPAIQRVLRESNEHKARLEAEQQLQVTLAQLRNFFDNLDEVFFSIDPRVNELLRISPACEQVYGLPHQAFFKNPDFWKQSINCDDAQTVGAAEADLRTGRTISYEYRIRRPDETLRWLHVKIKPVVDADGRIAQMDGIIADITERKELEAKFLRTQRLENLGSMAGGIAHDLNNVLSPIVMGIELLKSRHTDRKTQETLSTLTQCANRGASLVKQILMFARGAEGRRKTINAGHLIGETENMLRRAFPKSIHIVVDVPANLWDISVDETQFGQVLMNLCVNARDAMQHGGLMRISARNEPATDEGSEASESPGPHVAIEVSDTGQGIPAENLARIFDPFFTTKDPGKGTGLGLSTVQAIVKSHGGLLRVESTAQAGTRFLVYLPALVANASIEGKVPENDFPHGHNECILLVDDEAAIRNLTRSVLETYGYRVLVAADGREGLAVYSKNLKKIRLVLSDLDMPTMDGAEMIRRLRKINAGIPVISTSGFAPPEAGPVQAVLPKPFSTHHLLKAVRDALRSTQAGP